MTLYENREPGRQAPPARLNIRTAWVFLCLIAGFAAHLHASLTVFVREPFGKFGTVMPLGHTALYLDRVCADGPLKLRMCSPGEQPGVVLARYHSIGRYDWLASPVLQFLYARNRAQDVPAYVTPEMVWQMREQYRKEYLRAVVPDGSEGRFFGDGRVAGAKDLEEWWESAGMAYNRRVWAYEVNTTPEQDQHLIDVMNADANRHLYHLNKTNCADFVANLVNIYYPGAVHKDSVGDFGLMTPKEVARSLTDYARAHPYLDLRVWDIPQIPGRLRRSRPVRGGVESALKTKRYLFTLLAIQPEVPVGLAVLYLCHGRWKIGEGAQPWPGLPEQQWQTAIGRKLDTGREAQITATHAASAPLAGSAMQPGTTTQSFGPATER